MRSLQRKFLISSASHASTPPTSSTDDTASLMPTGAVLYSKVEAWEHHNQMIELLTGACTGKGLELVWEGRHEFLGHGNDAMESSWAGSACERQRLTQRAGKHCECLQQVFTR